MKRDPTANRDPASVTLSSLSLIERARDKEHPTSEDAWREIDERYRPMLIGFVRRMGIDLRGAESVAQTALSDFALAVRDGKVDALTRNPRGLLFGIARNKTIDYLRRGGSIGPMPGGSLGDFDVASEDEWNEAWELEENLAIERRVQEELRIHFKPRDVEIFNARTKENRPSKEVAERHNTTVGAVDQVKHKIREFLRERAAIIRERF